MGEDSESRDIDILGDSTRLEVVRADAGDSREWLRDALLCSLFKDHHIAHVGRMWACPPFQIRRAEASGTFVLVGIEGEGETLIDGEWRTVGQGEICLLPAFAPTEIRARNNDTWEFAWVRYEEERERAPILSSNSPVIHKGIVHPLAYAIAGLAAELENDQAEPAALHHWVELIHGFVQRAARPYQGDDRLWRVWEAVEKDLTKNWRLEDLEKIAHLSQEHLRRLSQQQLGRSPVQQVTYLRMRRAVELLASSDDKIESVAYEVGYENPFTFSNAFKRWTGRRPSEYREGRK
ncbi:MAG: AraC family transcriptional regulator [Verrucomicrobiota bacterium]